VAGVTRRITTQAVAILGAAACLAATTVHSGVFDAFDGFGRTYGECVDKKNLYYLEQPTLSAMEAKKKALAACRTKWAPAPPVIKSARTDVYSCRVGSATSMGDEIDMVDELMLCRGKDKRDAHRRLFAVCKPRVAQPVAGPAKTATVRFRIGTESLDADGFGSDGRIMSCVALSNDQLGLPKRADLVNLTIQTNAGQMVRR
jgi:hypothetical protein